MSTPSPFVTPQKVSNLSSVNAILQPVSSTVKKSPVFDEKSISPSVSHKFDVEQFKLEEKEKVNSPAVNLNSDSPWKLFTITTSEYYIVFWPLSPIITVKTKVYVFV